jgi:hypothetical protein
MTLWPAGQKIVPPSASFAATVRPPGCTVIALSADGACRPLGALRPGRALGALRAPRTLRAGHWRGAEPTGVDSASCH